MTSLCTDVCVVDVRYGPHPVQFWQWHLIEYNMQLCLAGLKEMDR